MSQDQEDKKTPREYVAFISYRHMELDKKVAKKIHTMIEHYVIPKELRGKDGNKKLGKVFRDEEELPVSSNLTESIQTALDHSKFLIVICTPDLPKSLWCEREIRYFIEKHGRENVIGILVDGTPDTSFPKPLTQAIITDADGNEIIQEVEPLAANLTDVNHKYQERRLHKEAVRLYAALLGCPFDSLWQRERRQKMRKLVALMSLVMVVALAFSISIYLKNLEISARNKQIEEQNAQIQKQNEEIKLQYQQIEAQYQEIEEKNSSLRLSEAMTLLREGELLCEKGDASETELRALQILSSQEGRDAYAADAEWLLYRATGAGKLENRMRTVDVIEQEGDVQNMLLTDDGSRLFVLGKRGYVRCYSTDDGEFLWMGDSGSNDYHYYVSERDRMILLEDQELLLCMGESVIVALSVKDGSTKWEYRTASSDGADFACLSPDGKTIVTVESEGSFFSQTNRLVVLDASSGEVQKRIDFPESDDGVRLVACGNVCGAFSEDGRYLAMTLYEGYAWSRLKNQFVFLADLQEDTVKMILKRELEYVSGTPFTIGMNCHSESKSLLLMHYNAVTSSVCMEEIFFDGKIGQNSEVLLTLPDRELGNSYNCSYVPGNNNGIIASCGELTFLYRQDNGALLDYDKYSSADVMKSHWIDDQRIFYAFLSSDGMQFTLMPGGIYMGEMTDKIHLIKMAFSRDYATIADESMGFRLSDHATMAVICDNDPQRIYVLKPARDLEIASAGWIEVPDVTSSDTVFQTLGEDGLILLSNLGDGSMRYQQYQVSTREKVRDFVFEIPGMSDSGAYYSVKEAFFWPDGKHFTYSNYGRNYGIYDLDAKTSQPLFGEDTDASYFCASVLENGDVLSAGLVVNMNFASGEETRILVWRINDGEIHRVSVDKALQITPPGDPFGAPLLYVGENGYILLAQFDKEDHVNSFLGWNALDGGQSEWTIQGQPALNASVALGRKKAVGAVTMLGGSSVQICDLSSNAVLNSITLSGGLAAFQIAFCDDDRTLAVWTVEGKLQLYDVQSGELRFEGSFESDDTAWSQPPAMTVAEDPMQNRIFFRLDNGAAIGVDRKYWKKTSDFNGMDAYCAKTREIFRKASVDEAWMTGSEGIFIRKAYTLDELMEKTKK